MLGRRIDRYTNRRISCCEFEHRVEGSNIALRRSEVVRLNMLIKQYVEGEDDASKNRTKHWKN